MKKQVAFGMKVQCVDGAAGMLSRVADGADRRGKLLVLERPHPFGHERSIPAELVADAQGGAVRLSIAVQQVDKPGRLHQPA